MKDKMKKEAEDRKIKRKDKQIDDADLGTEVSGGGSGLTGVVYTGTEKITKKIKTKI